VRSFLFPAVRFFWKEKTVKKCPEGTGPDPPHVHTKILPFFHDEHLSHRAALHEKKDTSPWQKKTVREKKKRKKKRKKEPTGSRNCPVRWTSRAFTRCLASVGRETPGAGTTTHPVTSLVTIAPPHRALSAFSAAPSHLLFPLVSFSFYFFTLFPAALLRDLHYNSTLQLLFDCANPSIECSLPKTLQSSMATRFRFARQSLLKSFSGSTGWLQVAPVCLVRTDKNLITAL
jgi:hypothetical protein